MAETSTSKGVTMKITHLFLLITAGITLNAYAAPPQIPLTVTIQGDGIVMRDPAGTPCGTDCWEYKKNTTVTLTATADPNSSFLGWDDACGGTDPTCVIQLRVPSVVTALFDTAAVAYPAPVLQTGQTRCWDEIGVEVACAGTGQDGDSQAGVPIPQPWLVDNVDGTITDTASGLMWLQTMDCIRTRYPELTHPISSVPGNGLVSWQQALDFVKGLNDGIYDCGAPPYANWRVPNIREIVSIMDYSVINTEPLSPFVDRNISPWSSTTVESEPNQAYWLRTQGRIVPSPKVPRTSSDLHKVWIVRHPE